MRIRGLLRSRAWLLLLVFITSRACRSADQFDPIRERIRHELASGRVPSIALAVARDNQILWEEAFGSADLENRIRATPHTIYTLGSTSKPITATALMLLHDRGLLNLDRPINDYLGDAKLHARIGNASGATVRSVAHHTAGLPGYYETFYPDEPNRPPNLDNVILRYGILMTPPGERFHYTNLGYSILGSVISRVSGKDYADFLHDEMFLRLGMSHSDVGTTPSLDQYRAIRYLLDGSRLPNYTTCCAAAADVSSSVHDLIRFSMLHMKVRLPDQGTLLSDRAINEMQHSTVQMGNDLYGIGWVISRDSKGRRRISHGGAGAGLNAQLTLIPDEKLAVAVLVNTHVDRHVAGEIADATLNALLREPPEENRPAAPLSNEVASARNPALPGELLGAWAGVVNTHKRNVPVTLWFQASGEGAIGVSP